MQATVRTFDPQTRCGTVLLDDGAELTFDDAAFTAGRAALLGAALASGSPTLFAAALADRLHEPYRVANAPLLAEIRADLPEGALGATLSGSGPTVIVWAEAGRADEVAGALRAHDAEVLTLAVAGGADYTASRR